MEGVIATNGVAIDYGIGALYWEILWSEMRILGYVIGVSKYLTEG